jgi:hypothetical protein
MLLREIGFALDSLLEESGFELMVPPPNGTEMGGRRHPPASSWESI